jgi:hypothetical protein
MLHNVWAAFTAWFAAPFRQPLDAIHLFLGVGLVILSIIIWGRILQHIHE